MLAVRGRRPCRAQAAACDSVVVPVPLVGGVPVPFVHVVDMVAVGHGDMAAAASVLVLVALVRRVTGGRALVDVPGVRAVDVSVVHVVDVVAVRDGDVPAALPVPVVVALVGAMLGDGRHDVLPMRIGQAAARSAASGLYRINIG